VAGDLRRAWEGIGEFFDGLFGGIERRAKAVADAVRSLLDSLPGGGQSPTGDVNDPEAQRRRRENFRDRGRGDSSAPSGDARQMGFLGRPLGALGSNGQGQEQTPVSAFPVTLRPESARRQVDVGGQVRITVDDQRVRVAARPDNPEVDWDVSRGFAMSGI
jgi:hypothetical protein